MPLLQTQLKQVGFGYMHKFCLIIRSITNKIAVQSQVIYIGVFT